MNIYRNFLVLILLIESLLLTGCFNFKPKDDPSRFFTLNATCIKQKQGGVNKILGVTRVIIPDYMDRAKIVTEVRESEFNIAEFDCWADSIDRGISRVITENLSAQLPCVSVLPFPWRDLSKPDLELHVHILEFKPQLYKSETLLLARYYITNPKKNEAVCSDEVLIRVPINLECDCYLGIVLSMNEALAQLSKRIADRIL